MIKQLFQKRYKSVPVLIPIASFPSAEYAEACIDGILRQNPAARLNILNTPSEVMISRLERQILPA